MLFLCFFWGWWSHCFCGFSRSYLGWFGWSGRWVDGIDVHRWKFFGGIEAKSTWVPSLRRNTSPLKFNGWKMTFSFGEDRFSGVICWFQGDLNYSNTWSTIALRKLKDLPKFPESSWGYYFLFIWAFCWLSPLENNRLMKDTGLCSFFTRDWRWNTWKQVNHPQIMSFLFVVLGCQVEHSTKHLKQKTW